MAREKICGVYKISSIMHPDRCYIGSAVDILRRWYRHREDLNKQLHNDILQNHYNKYGKDDLLYEVIEKFEFISKEHLLGREQFFIDNDVLNAYFCVNKTAGSCMGTKRTFTAEHKRHMSEARQGIVFSDEHCANISKGRKGIPSKKKGQKKPGYKNSGTWEKGNVPWNKGKKTGQEVWNKNKKTGIVPKSVFKKGQTPWNKGVKMPFIPHKGQSEAMKEYWRRKKEERESENSQS